MAMLAMSIAGCKKTSINSDSCIGTVVSVKENHYVISAQKIDSILKIEDSKNRNHEFYAESMQINHCWIIPDGIMIHLLQRVADARRYEEELGK